jgi:phospholipid N-methyltransferase
MNRTRTEPRPWLDRLQEQLRLPPTSGLLFFLQFLSNPKGVGAIVPTSNAAVDGLLRHVDWETCRLFVEYGPGTGAFTRHVLERAHPDARIIAIDPNPRFVDHLRHSLFDPRLTVVQGSAADVEDILAAHGGEKADYILSGLPFSTNAPLRRAAPFSSINIRSSSCRRCAAALRTWPSGGNGSASRQHG